MKKILPLITLIPFTVCAYAAAQQHYPLKRADLRIRDPYVFADKSTGKYYIQANSLPSQSGDYKMQRALFCYESENLEDWKLVGKSFQAPKDFWGKRDFWAPDMFKFGGKYYIIATFSNDKIIGKRFDKPDENLPFRGCAGLESHKPDGPYAPLTDKPITPDDMSALDATLFEEDGKLYMVYCREWLQVGDGQIVAQEISRDLKTATGKPVVLFSASQAPWTRSIAAGKKCYITDAPVVNRAPDGKLYMTWSSFTKKGGKRAYAIGISYSENGKLFGEWKHSPEILNSDDGGHAMTFRTFDGKMKLSYHAPNSKTETPVFRDLVFKDGKFFISDK